MEIYLPIHLPEAFDAAMPFLLRLVRYLAIRYRFVRLVWLTRRLKSLDAAIRAMGYKLVEPYVYVSDNELSTIVLVRATGRELDVRIGVEIRLSYAPVKE